MSLYIMFELTDPVSEVDGACHQEVVFYFREFRPWGHQACEPSNHGQSSRAEHLRNSERLIFECLWRK